MACASCGEKYAALRRARRQNKTVVNDAAAPRNIKPPRRGIIRKSEKLTTTESVSPSISEENVDGSKTDNSN